MAAAFLKAKMKGSPTTFPVGVADAGFVFFNKMLYQVKANPKAGLGGCFGRLHLVKPLEQLLPGAGRNAWTAVFYRDLDPVAGFLHPEKDLATFRRVFKRIGKQVVQDDLHFFL